MILVDVNLLLYAHSASAPRHEQARIWWRDTLSNPEPVGIPWATTLAFLRISTSPRAYTHPLVMAEAIGLVSEWLLQPQVSWVAPGERHWRILTEVLKNGSVTTNLVTDAHLAALAIEHGAVLCTTDRDFARFRGLQWMNPLDEEG